MSNIMVSYDLLVADEEFLLFSSSRKKNTPTNDPVDSSSRVEELLTSNGVAGGLRSFQLKL